MAKIAIVEGEDRRRCARAVCDELGEKLYVPLKTAESVVIGVEFGIPGRRLTSVESETVRGVIEFIRPYTNAPITILGGGEAPASSFLNPLEYSSLLTKYPALLFLDACDGENYEEELQRVDGGAWRVRRPKAPREATVTISIGRMKTDPYLGAKLGIATWAELGWQVPARHSVAGVSRTRTPWYDVAGPEGTAHMIETLYASLPCHFSIIDAVLGLQGGGNEELSPVPMGLMIASDDPLAADAASLAFMGFDPDEIPYILNLAQRGQGDIDPMSLNLPPHLLAVKAKNFRRAVR